MQHIIRRTKANRPKVLFCRRRQRLEILFDALLINLYRLMRAYEDYLRRNILYRQFLVFLDACKCRNIWKYRNTPSNTTSLLVIKKKREKKKKKKKPPGVFLCCFFLAPFH